MSLTLTPQNRVPELPETETIARDLHVAVRGAIINAVSVARPDVLRETDAKAMGATLESARIDRVWRRAKMVVLDCTTDASHFTTAASGQTVHVVVQPRFTGGLIIADREPIGADAMYVCLTLSLADGRFLYYRDVRRLGTVALMSAIRFAEYELRLGAEPLDPTFTYTDLSVLLRATNRPVKAALMDQRRLAGIGNIYANEALWLAGIDPSRAASTLSTSDADALHSALTSVLTASIAARGTSFRDYRDAHGERGSFVEQLAAYGRAGAPCHRCQRRLVGTHAIDGRSTVFCPTCQR